jgi:branched-chain amino acid transport system substrate-binding protein
LAAVVAVVMAGLLCAACSSSKGGSAASSAAPSSTGSKATGTPIELGIIISAPYVGFAPQGAEAAIAAINDAGGVNGHPLKLDVCNDQSDANAAAACATGFAGNSAIVATVGDTSSFGGSSNPPLAAAKIAGIGTAPLGAGDFSSARVFATSPGGLEFLATAAFMYSTLKISNIGMALVGTPTAAALPGTINSQVLKPLGGAITQTATIPPTATDVSTQAATLSGTKGQLLAISQAISVQYITSSRQQGFSGPFVLSESLIDAKVLQKDVSASNLNGVYAVTYFDKTSAGYAHFLKDMKQYQPNIVPNDLNALAWLGVQTFAKVAKPLPSITRDSVFDAMNQQSALSTDGMTATLNYTAPGTALGGSAPRIISSVQSVYIDQYKDGVWVPYATPQQPVPLFPKAAS